MVSKEIKKLDRGQIMSPKKQVQLSSLRLAGIILIIFAYGLVLFYLPLYLESKTDTGEPLNFFIRFVLQVRSLTKIADILMIPALIFGFFFAVIWWIQSSVKYRKGNTPIDESN